MNGNAYIIADKGPQPDMFRDHYNAPVNVFFSCNLLTKIVWRSFLVPAYASPFHLCVSHFNWLPWLLIYVPVAQFLEYTDTSKNQDPSSGDCIMFNTCLSMFFHFLA